MSYFQNVHFPCSDLRAEYKLKVFLSFVPECSLMLFLLLFFFTVDVGEEIPRTVCSGLVGSEPLEELQVQAVQPFLY